MYIICRLFIIILNGAAQAPLLVSLKVGFYAAVLKTQSAAGVVKLLIFPFALLYLLFRERKYHANTGPLFMALRLQRTFL